MSLNILKIISLPALMLLWPLGLDAADSAKIELEFGETPMQSIEPDAQTYPLTIRVSQADGVPVKRARLKIELDAPSSDAFFSTDFPIVEGTRLLDCDVELVNGSFTMDYMYPIRGIYGLQVTASPLDGDMSFAKTVQQLPLTLNEVPAEVSNFKTLLALLIGFGLVSGIILGRSAKANSGELAT